MGQSFKTSIKYIWFVQMIKDTQDAQSLMDARWTYVRF